MIIHQTLPVLTVQFLYLLLSSFNKVMKKKLAGTLKTTNGWQFDVQIFNLNISHLSLPQITNEQVIDEYESAFSHEIA